jgi:release factor glutamine methyltransferase
LIDSAVATWKDLYQVAASRLGDGPEARWVVEEVAGVSWPALLADNPRPSEKARSHLDSMIDRRLAGEPLQYVLGHWPFRDLDLMVDRRVLIPRPETEQVVEVALEELDRLTRPSGRGSQAGTEAGARGTAGAEGGTCAEPGSLQAPATPAAVSSPGVARPRPARSGPPVAVDLGTGSGAIALSIVAERPRVRVWATDASADALAVASANLAGLAGFTATRVRLCHGSWWSALPDELRGSVDLLVSNPPYVASSEMAGLAPEIHDWEPATALEAGPRGLDAIEEILASAPEWLRPGGAAVIEIAPHQAALAERAARRAGFADVQVKPDLAGRHRALIARTGLAPAAGQTRGV